MVRKTYYGPIIACVDPGCCAKMWAS